MTGMSVQYGEVRGEASTRRASLLGIAGGGVAADDSGDVVQD